MEQEQTRQAGESPDDMLTPKQAAEYLGRKWDRPFTPRDLINLRFNRGINATYTEARLTLWKRSDLDHIIATQEPPRLRGELHGKPGRPRKRRVDTD